MTTRLPSTVQASDICGLPGNASKAATVVTAAGALATVHPSMVVAVIIPVTPGAVLSSTFMIWIMSTLVLTQASVTL